uniref:Copia protein n=1 Tax=Cacopsylla melanoneura TaxID=428564 RepID=A0A8D8PVW5_9HEMI
MAEGGEEKYHVPLFTGNNYDNWRFRLEVLLDEKGLLKYVENEVELEPEPSGTESSADKTTREKSNSVLEQKGKYCKRLIISTIADSHLEYCKGKSSAFQVWKSLESTFQRKGIACQLQVRKKLLSMKHNTNDSLESHFLKFDNLIRSLKAAGGNLEEMDIICHLLLTMPSEYNMVVTAIETFSTNNADMNLSFVKGRLLDEESKRKVCGKPKSTDSSAVFFTQGKNRKGKPFKKIFSK